MNPEEFESRLQRMPLKQPPGEWREEILAAASTVAADVNQRTSSVRELKFAATWQQRLRDLFWPHPVAWGAMAAVWLVIGVVQLALHEPTSGSSRVYVAASPGVPTVMELQKELLTAWNEPSAKPKAKPEAPLPPQSCIERRRETFEA